MSSLFYIALPLSIVVGHIGLLPVIFSPELFGIGQRLSITEQTDVALIIAPLTSASFITIVKYAVDSKNMENLGADIKNILYPIVSIFVVSSFFVSLYFFIIRFHLTAGADAQVLKSMVGVTEVFFGAAYAVIVSSLAGSAERG